MKKIDMFRKNLRSFLERQGRGAQADLSRKANVPPYVLSRFLSGSDISGSFLLPIQEYLASLPDFLAHHPTTPSQSIHDRLDRNHGK